MRTKKLIDQPFKCRHQNLRRHSMYKHNNFDRYSIYQTSVSTLCAKKNLSASTHMYRYQIFDQHSSTDDIKASVSTPCTHIKNSVGTLCTGTKTSASAKCTNIAPQSAVHVSTSKLTSKPRSAQQYVPTLDGHCLSISKPRPALYVRTNTKIRSGSYAPISRPKTPGQLMYQHQILGQYCICLLYFIGQPLMYRYNPPPVKQKYVPTQKKSVTTLCTDIKTSLQFMCQHQKFGQQ